MSVGLARRLALLGSGILLVSFLVGPLPAEAWKPYTHIQAGYKVWDQVTSTGSVTIETSNGTQHFSHSYPVDTRIVDALRSYPDYYNGGVIGPDAFPDIAYGQAIIHPNNTGEWLKYIYDQAWLAQSDAQYTTEERKQILAFAYGYLTHAAGDVWGHSFINGYAGGVFPSITNTITSLGAGDSRRLLIALRHLVVEAYIGNATPGYDSFDTTDLPDVINGCNPANVINSGGAIDTQCVSDNNSLIEFSPVCDPNNPPTRAGTTCLVIGSGNQLVNAIDTDSTQGIQLNEPHKFMQNVLIDQNAVTPNNACVTGNFPGASATNPGCPLGTFQLASTTAFPPNSRGPVIDGFVDLEAQLQIASATYHDRLANDCLKNLVSDCHHEDGTIDVATVRGIQRGVPVSRWVCTSGVLCSPDPSIFIPVGLEALYTDGWISDLQAGLQQWDVFSLAVARGLFDPQARRDARYDACKTQSDAGKSIADLTNIAHEQCLKGVSRFDAAIFEAHHILPDPNHPSFIREYLMEMLGAPHVLGDISQILADMMSAIDNVALFLGISNPISAIVAQLDELVRSLIEQGIQKALGIDIVQWEEFYSHMSHWMCGLSGAASITIPPPLGPGPNGITITAPDLFTAAQHTTLDGQLGLPDPHHSGVDPDPGFIIPGVPLPADCKPLLDLAKMDTVNFAPFADTVTMSKLLLLDGPNLDRAFGDALVDQGVISNPLLVKTYQPSVTPPAIPANIMIDALGNGAIDTSATWLKLIDGDHAWRQNGLPRFCYTDYGAQGPGSTDGMCGASLPAVITANYSPQPQPRVHDDTGMPGGNGTFPVWQSCMLRPAFQALFKDWENGQNPDPSQRNFPDYGIAASPDNSDAAAPTASTAATANLFVSGGTTFVGASNQFTLTTSDSVFQAALVDGRYRIYKLNTTPGQYVPSSAPFLASGYKFSIPATSGDGFWNIDSQAQNVCFQFGPQSAASTESVFLDTTAPVITINQPVSGNYTHSQTLTLDYSVSDGAGSGVKTFGATLDGSSTLNGHGLQSGQAINLLTELPLGPHTFVVTATDNVGNIGSNTVTFNIIVTAASIQDDVNQFLASGDISKDGIGQSLLAKLRSAAAAEARGNCTAATNVYMAFIHELEAQVGKSITQTAASIMIADAQYLIAHC